MNRETFYVESLRKRASFSRHGAHRGSALPSLPSEGADLGGEQKARALLTALAGEWSEVQPSELVRQRAERLLETANKGQQ